MKLNSFLPGLLEWNNQNSDAFVYFNDEHASSQLHVKQFGMMWCEGGYSYGFTKRDHLLIHFVMSGKGKLSIDEKRFEIGEGQLFVIPPHEVSYYCADQQTPWCYYYVGFKGELARAVLDFFRQDRANMYCREFDMDKMRPLLEEMQSHMLAEDGYLHLISGMYRLVGMLCDTRGVGDMEHDRFNREQAEPMVNKVIAKIEREFHMPISVEQIAYEMGVNRSYLTESFKRYTERSIKNYIMELRIRRAKVQLSHMQLSMQQVAAMCGYSDPLYFSRVFKKYVGCSPSEYRRKIECGEIDELD